MQEMTRNIDWEFTDKKVTPWGGMRMFKQFLDQSGIREQLRVSGLPQPMSNCGYDPVMMMESFWVTVWLGGVRFSHTAIVRFDDALKDIFGWARVPCVSTYTRFFKKFKREEVDHTFSNINRWFFAQMPARNFTVDLDSSVMTRYGQQEGSVVGYNPQKRGRRSHHPIMAFIADIRMVAHSWLRPGNTSSANGSKTFLSETLAILGKHQIGLLRADAGFFDGGFLDYLESKVISYIVAVKMNRILKEKIVVPGCWLKLDNGIDVAEFEYQAQSWQKPRRMVVIRQLLDFVNFEVDL